jgi:trk system potassium uptake protein TrkH
MDREGPIRRRRVARQPRPGVALATGFLVLIAIGSALLTTPLASASGAWTSPVDALFTATSAVCVTGLAVVDTGTYWSPFGQVVVLLLIQLGGFGFMSGSTLLLLLLVGRGTSLNDRIGAQETLGVRDLGSVRPVLRLVVVFTIVSEVAGWVVLGLAFLARSGDAANAAWYGLFHSISAFNNAGFDLIGGFHSFTGYADDPVVLVPIAVLVILGGLGAAIVGDVFGKRRWHRLALETKLVLAVTAVLVVGGTAGLLLFERGNPGTLGSMAPPEAVLNAAFQSVTFRSAGIASVPTAQLTDPSLLLGGALMFIGGASGSTAGGIKITTFAILLAAVIATVRGRPHVEAFGRRVPDVDVRRALAVALLSIALLFVVVLSLEVVVPDVSFLHLVFEAVSGFGTVGLSADVTPTLPDPALLILAVTMFIGRLGPLSLVLALNARQRPVVYRPAVESVRIG